MKAFINKARNIQGKQSDLMNDLWFQSLPVENKKDLYAAIDAYKTFIDNAPKTPAELKALKK